MGNDTHFSNRQYTAYSVFLGVFFLIGFGAQVIAILALRRNENRSKKLTLYWLNLAACNIVVIMASFPISFASAVNHEYVGKEVGCQVSGVRLDMKLVRQTALLTGKETLLANAVILFS